MTFSLRSGFDFGFSPAPQVVAEVTKLLYIVVVDEEESEGKTSFRYTRPILQSTLQLMGCKARQAFKMSKRVFEVIRGESPTSGRHQDGAEVSCSDPHKKNSVKEDSSSFGCGLDKAKEDKQFLPLKDDRRESKTFEFYKKRTTVVVRRETFLDVVCNALTEYNYLGHNQRADLVLACRIREKKQSVTVLLCGTSGCGKSTLSSLLGSRLGITTVISTDSIRHMMRSFVDEKQNPLLWSSTYHAGEFLDPVVVAEAKAKKRARKMEGIAPRIAMGEALSSSSTAKYDDNHMQLGSSGSKLINPKQMAIEGFKAQSEMVIDSLDRLITAWEERKESVVVEGVHLSLNFVMGLMKKHPSIIPFMIYISNEEKHLERFAVRAKYMTLDPAKNKYVKYIKNIRTIQEYLCRRADKHLVPKINNTNVDRSVATIHATVFSCLRRRNTGEQLYDSTTNTVAVVDEEYRSQCAANSLLSSKGMFQLIQRNGSNRQLMALLNTDGSVAKVWPVDSVESYEMSRVVNMKDNGINNPVDGHLHIGKAEPVNLQFGNFGISAWPNNGDTSHCGTSIAGGMEDSKGETETGSRHYSSCCSSPTSYGNSKEVMEEQSVYGSDEEEEVYDTPQDDSDDDLHDANSDQILEEVGSVDEEAKTDEEYDDLAIQDVQESGYWSDNDELRDSVVKGKMKGDNCCRIKQFQRSRSDHLSENYLSNSSSPLAKETYQKKLASRRIKNRSNSIPVVGKTRVYVQ